MDVVSGFWCDDDVAMNEPYCMIGSATTLPKDDSYEPKPARPIGFVWTAEEVKDG